MFLFGKKYSIITVSGDEVMERDNKIIIKNEKEETFVITYGGADLYWLMDDYNSDNNFIISKETGLFYEELDKVFKIIEEKDNNYDKTLTGNCFEWLSDAFGLPEHANKLQITKEQDKYCIKFIRNPENWSPQYTCYISFCLSGSKNTHIATAFSKMVLNCLEKENNKKLIKIL